MKKEEKHILFVMGVSGSGKSTIGSQLADELHYPFFDGDDFHPESNVFKMKAGDALNDEDRYEWLLALNNLAKENQSKGAVIACSALKENYRNLLQNDVASKVHFIYLKGTFATILERLKKREEHFMPVELLQSQFDTLVPPTDAIVVDIDQQPEQIVKAILTSLK